MKFTLTMISLCCCLVLSACAQLGRLDPWNHQQCVVKNLTSGQSFSAYGETIAQAKLNANQDCVANSAYGWRCSLQSCHAN